MRRKKGTRDIALRTAKQQLEILGSVKWRLPEECVEAWCPGGWSFVITDPVKPGILQLLRCRRGQVEN